MPNIWAETYEETLLTLKETLGTLCIKMVHMEILGEILSHLTPEMFKY